MADPTDYYAQEIYAVGYIGNVLKVTVTKVEEYEGNLIISTDKGYRAKVDDKTKNEWIKQYREIYSRSRRS